LIGFKLDFGFDTNHTKKNTSDLYYVKFHV